MPERRRRRLAIAVELRTWADALPNVLSKISRVRHWPRITDAQATDIEKIAANMDAVLCCIRAAVDAEDYDRVSASVDRLREEIIRANRTLDRMLPTA